MPKLTTIPKLMVEFNLTEQQIISVFKKNEIKTVTEKDVYIGFRKQPRQFIYADCKKACEEYILSKTPIKVNKNYSNEFICKVLRKHTNSSLNNKVISTWSFIDWKEFNSLIPNQNVQL
ncbi:hypothetical protein D3C86_1285680 [compost metagenome]